MRKRTQLGMALFLCLAFVSALRAQSNSPVQYFYDDLGRLTRVVDQNGNVASYNYDAVGNLLSISHSTLPANNGLAILNFTPQTGAVGASVTIQGQGFSATPTANAVQFNGTPATVTSATTSALSVTVPTGTTTGPISVTVAGTTATSDANFTVAPLSLISISVTSSLPTISTGQASQYRATGLYNNGTTQDVTTTVTWSAANASIATVSNSSGSQGVVRGVSNGFTTIAAASGSVSGTAPVTVAAFASLTVTATSSCLVTGITQQFTAQAQYVNGTIADVTAGASWSSSNTTVAVISNATGTQGLATTLATGVTTITANWEGYTSSVSLVVAPPLPAGWGQQDVGTVGVSGCAGYLNDDFNVTGAGADINGTADGFHFVYQPLSGDGTIVARVVNLQGAGGGVNQKAGVMIRETLNSGATNAYMAYETTSSTNLVIFDARTSTGGSTNQDGFISRLFVPYWVKLVRSGSTFSGYASPDGVNWTQVGTTQTITMATDVYVGLAVTNANSSGLATATFDNVSVSSAANPAPVITNVSATTGAVGSQVVITGTGFGEPQASDEVLLNDAPVTIDSWSATSITITIPQGATSGILMVSVAPTMDDSNPVYFEVTAQPLPTGWLDGDVGVVGVAGNATFTNGTFTVNGAGSGINNGSAPDGFHFVYQPLLGDGTIVARVVTLQVPGGASAFQGQQAGVMIRETLDPYATNAYMCYQAGPFTSHEVFSERMSTGGSTGQQELNGTYLAWVKLVRSGSSFSGYASPDGVNWVQIGTTQTITMATDVYIGLAVTNANSSALATATFDNVSVSSAANPAPVITNVSATTGSVGSQVVITGTGFGEPQGGDEVLLNDAPVTIDSWSATSITITIPAGATSGILVVSVAPSMDDSNPVYFEVTAQPLPTGWLDGDVGEVGVAGNATFANGAFTVNGAGSSIDTGTADGFHFVYQPLSGDGTIVARVVNLQGAGGGAYQNAGVMIRETLSAAATNAYMSYQENPSTNGAIFSERTSTGGSSGGQGLYGRQPPPYWVKLVRSGSTFSGYASPDGVNWTQVGTTQTITMATDVYVGLAVTNANSSALATATFDNVSVTGTP
jgi:YD repeat-containing protein